MKKTYGLRVKEMFPLKEKHLSFYFEEFHSENWLKMLIKQQGCRQYILNKQTNKQKKSVLE